MLNKLRVRPHHARLLRPVEKLSRVFNFSYGMKRKSARIRSRRTPQDEGGQEGGPSQQYRGPKSGA